MLDVPALIHFTTPGKSTVRSVGNCINFSQGNNFVNSTHVSWSTITIKILRIEGCPFAIHPRLHSDMIGDKTWNRAFEDDIVAEQDIFGSDPCVKTLTNH